MLVIIKILIFIIYITKSTADEIGPIVTLPDGRIRGHVLKTFTNKEYYAFQEVPFAAPPVGELRFKEPIAPEPWVNILNTTENTKICIQAVAADKENEDCLYLNVYTPLNPEEDSPDPLPVFFWIYGGSFTTGDGTFQLYGPQHFIDLNVVVVTTNYRLGPLGFLTTGDGVIPGNLGLKDQNFALNWTHRNIKLFGGDPSKITIAGESAGSVSVGYQLISKKSNGLFRGAILESGTSLNAWAVQKYANYYAYQLGSALNPEFTTNNSSAELLKLLQSVPGSAISAVTINPVLGKNNRAGYLGLVWTPVIEDENDEAFITSLMYEDVKNGNFNQVPILIGFNSEEELLFLVEQEVKDQAAYFDQHLSSLVNDKFTMSDENKTIAGTALRKIYTETLFQDAFAGTVRFLSDEGLTTSIIKHAELQSKYTDVYLYQFAYKGQLGGLNISVPGAETVGHTEELHYLWSLNGEDVNNYPPNDKLTQIRMLKLWTNFVKYLNPTPDEDALLENIIWPKVTPDNLVYLNINSTFDVRVNPKEYLKWREIIDAYAQPPLTTYS